MNTLQSQKDTLDGLSGAFRESIIQIFEMYPLYKNILRGEELKQIKKLDKQYNSLLLKIQEEVLYQTLRNNTAPTAKLFRYNASLQLLVNQVRDFVTIMKERLEEAIRRQKELWREFVALHTRSFVRGNTHCIGCSVTLKEAMKAYNRFRVMHSDATTLSPSTLRDCLNEEFGETVNDTWKNVILFLDEDDAVDFDEMHKPNTPGVKG